MKILVLGNLSLVIHQNVTRLGVGLSTALVHVQLSPQSGPTFCGPHLVACKVMRSDCRSWCSCGVSVVKRVNLLWTIGRDVHYPTHEPNPVHFWEFGPRKSLSWFCQASLKVWRQNCATYDVAWDEWVLRPKPSIKPLGWIWWNRAILLNQIFRVQAGLESGPKYKVGLTCRQSKAQNWLWGR